MTTSSIFVTFTDETKTQIAGVMSPPPAGFPSVYPFTGTVLSTDPMYETYYNSLQIGHKFNSNHLIAPGD
jgi:hypothetical protein